MNEAGIDAARWRAAEQGYHAEPWEALPGRVQRSSRGLPWRGLSVWHQVGPVEDLYLPPAGSHCVIFRRGAATQLVQRQGARTQARTWSTGEVVVVPAGTPTFWRSAQPRDNVHLDIAPQWLEQAAGGQPVTLPSCFGTADPLLRELVQVLLTALDTNTSLQPAFGDAMAMSLALHLVHRFAEDGREPASALSARQLRLVTGYVQANLRAPCDVPRLAAEVRLSPAHFARCFKATCGITPHQFVLRLKMERARELLLTTDEPVAAIAQATGFASRAHFAQAFRRHWGAPPAALRRRS